MRRTLFLMAVCGILAFSVLAARLYILQVRDHDKYEELAISQQLRETGSIRRARNDIRLQHERPRNERECGQRLPEPCGDRHVQARTGSSSPISSPRSWGSTREDILKKTENNGSWYVTVARKVEKETADKVRAV